MMKEDIFSRSRLFVLIIFFVAFVIRLISLNQSLWLDEGVTARVVQEYNVLSIVRVFSPTDFHPPIYYLFMKMWTYLFGYSEIALRMPSVIFSLLTGWIIYRIFIVYNPKYSKEALWAAVFFLFNPLIIYYSQEARMYMMAVFLLTTGWYCVEKNIKDKSIVSAFCAGLFFSLAFASFYGSIFFIATILICLFFQKKNRSLFIVLCGTLLVTVFLLSPLLLTQFQNSRSALSRVANWKNVLGTVNVKNALLIPLKFIIGRISFYPKWLYWLSAGIGTVIVWFFVFLGGLQKKGYLFLLLFPLVLGMVFSFFSPLLQYFRFLYVIPVMSILLVYGTRNTKLVRIILLLLFIMCSLAYVIVSQFHREDWKSMAHSLPYAAAVYMILPSSDAFTYYRPDIRLRELRELNSVAFKDKQILVVPYVFDVYGFDYVVLLKAAHFRKERSRNFRGVLLEKWEQ